ncbi:MAG: efflux RND transporter periplasmic adaptor subunit [Anaerolineales bacterium]
MKKFLRALLVLLVIGGAAGGYWYYRRAQTRQNAQTAIQSLRTVAVSTGDLDVTIDATGKVAPAQTALLTWQTSGKVQNVLVQSGQQVQADEILAELAQSSLPQSLILAQADLYTARQNLQDYYDSFSELALAQAEKNVADARMAVEDAQTTLDSLQSPARQTDIDQAYANMILAKQGLERAQERFAPYENKPADNVVRATMASKLAQAQAEYDSAVWKYNALNGTGNATDIAVAQADLALQQQKLAEAESNYAALLAGPDAEEVAALEAKITAIEANLAQASLTAPFAATVTQVDIAPGDMVKSGQQAFRLDDISRLKVDVSVSEIDLPLIEIGQSAALTFDALPGREYHGTVSEIALVGEETQGVVNFTVTITLNDADEAVRPGMTAEVTILVAQRQGVLLVPNQALQVRNGQQVVYILQNGLPRPVPVTLGTMGQDYSEVTDGPLQAGDQVVLNYEVLQNAASTDTAGGVPFGPGILGGRPPGAGAGTGGGRRTTGGNSGNTGGQP